MEDAGTIIIQVTAIIGGLAALVAILNGIFDLREKRRKSREANRAKATEDVPPPSQPSPASPPPSEALPAAMSPRRLTNLPAQTTRLIGREDEVAEVKQLLLRPGVRLVTLTGPGGTGKTRLALEVAAESLERYADGVFLVKLASVSDANLVVPTIAQALDVREQGGKPLLDMLKDLLHEKHMLLVLDNFEQVIAATPAVAELLAAAPDLQVLATSREVLRLSGEYVYTVPPLTLPDLDRLPEGPDLVSSLSEYEAVHLFVERAQEANASFVLTDENARAVAEICYHLDGLPLAIELAAARIRLLSPQAMLKRLVVATGGSSLTLLTGGSRDLPTRQQTLRNTIAWSYDLLDEGEQGLLQRLAVFAGGWTLEAGERVCGASGAQDVLDGLESLVAKSLVQRAGSDGDGRFAMLLMIREYALERLEESGLDGDVRNAHAAWLLELVEEAEPKLYGTGQLEWLARLETEHDNLRAALRWTLDSGQGQLALRLAGNLSWFWHHDRVSEGRGWLEAALAAGRPDRTQDRARALLGLGDLVSNQGDWPTALAALEESVSIAREVNDRRLLARGLADLYLFKVRGAAGDGAGAQTLADESLELARSLGEPWTLGYVLTVLDICRLLLGDTRHGSALSEEALANFEKTGDQWGIVLTLRHLSMGATIRGDYAAARSAGERGLAASRALGDRVGQAYTLNALGDISRLQGDYDAASSFYEEGLALYRELGLKADIPANLHCQGYLALARGDTETARALQTESLTLHREMGNRAGMMEAITGLAAVARVSGDIVPAARLFGAVEALRASIGVPVWPAERVEYDSQVSALGGQMNEKALARAWAEGRAMTLEQTVAVALGEEPVKDARYQQDL